VNPEYPLLSCLVLSQRHEHHKLVSTWLGECNYVGSVTAVSDDSSLGKYLNKAHVHLCIVVLEKHEITLPASILSHAHIPVVALTATRKPEKIRKLIQQGATEVVSIGNTYLAKHAISRLLAECRSKQKLRFLQAHIQVLEKQVAYLQSILMSDKRSFALTAANDAEHKSVRQIEAKLQSMQQPVVENVIANYKPRDSATGLRARISVLKKFQQVLASEIKAPRFTALLVSILTDKDSGEQSGASKNVQDLTLFRAADALKKRLGTGIILGRINQNALLLIQSSYDEPVSRDAANRVRDSLGSLGGLIDAETDVRINTINLPAKTSISANEVVARLEASAI